MDTEGIVAELSREISALQAAKIILSNGKKPVKRVMSAAGRQRISAAQKKRWAKSKAA